MGIPLSGFTRGVALGDSLTKANSSPLDGIGYTEIISTLNSNIECVKRGVSGRTLAGMVSAFSSEVPTVGCGPNLITNSEFYTDVSGWVEEATESSISQVIGAFNVAALRITNNDATGGFTYQEITGLDTGKQYVYSGRQPPSSTFDPRLFAGSTAGGIDQLGGELANTFSQRSFSPTVSDVFFAIQNAAIGAPNSCDITEIEVREDLSPEFVVLLGGINDVSGGATEAAMSSNRDLLIADALAASIEPILCTVAPWNSATVSQQTAITDYNIATRNVAISNNYALVDVYPSFEDPDVAEDLNPLYDNGDGLHWNTEGHTRFAELLLSVLQPSSVLSLTILWDRYLTFKGFPMVGDSITGRQMKWLRNELGL